ncbi:proline dehydrogenase family protein [Promicromonospora sukumoe]|uniref:proline dehydrogenase family protein n=1 Tax=Promicromonospora sukumoe TaxID=88382 RepID=UPI0003733AA7|nr:proline dehydrogenase family protein [Promicromonospora sukumoe]
MTTTSPELKLEPAADTLRAWALDEDLKRTVLANPALAAAAARIARRYTAGETVDQAIDAARAGMRRGHTASIDYVGESIRDAATARRETDVFLRLVEAVRAADVPATISFDLSHVGSLVDRDLGLAHARELAAATADLGTALVISAEGSDRTDLVLDLHEALSAEFDHVGITLQARLHRTPQDLRRVLRHPGPVRLVKGAFLEPESVAYRRDSAELTDAYLAQTAELLDARHPVFLATHDDELVATLRERHGAALTEPGVEFEMLLGLGTELLDQLHGEGFATREYLIFGDEWWLYVLNRIAEDPTRVITALADLRP